MAMSDGVTSLLAMATGMYFANGLVPSPGADFLNGGIPAYNVFQCSDGKWISIGSLEPWFWAETCKALGCEEYIPHQNNREKFPEIFDYMRSKFKEKTRDEWFEELRKYDICVGPVLSLDEVFANPHVLSRQMMIEVDHPELGKVKQVGIAAKFSETPGGVRSFSPARGQHTDAVLKEFGFSEAQVADLREAGAAG
jgi:crotonobetainyl-CoA:carnitine CoA-transferase CaiB-like acyl-CoA transferase